MDSLDGGGCGDLAGDVVVDGAAAMMITTRKRMKHRANTESDDAILTILFTSKNIFCILKK